MNVVWVVWGGWLVWLVAGGFFASREVKTNSRKCPSTAQRPQAGASASPVHVQGPARPWAGGGGDLAGLGRLGGLAGVVEEIQKVASIFV